ncbi:hypothetical protein OF83DRAFT_782671 [Amylostereum chailletii]|nr:hypothetical protein OF83DRAFT_782671 [Amylostereum chailletii]
MNVVDCTLDALSPTPATLHHWESATAGPSETAPDYSSYNSSVDIGTPSSDPYQAGREFYRPHQQWQEENRNIYDRRTPRLPHPPMSGPIPSAQYMPPSMGPPFHPRISNHNGEYPGPPPGINEPSYGNGYGYGNKYGYGRGQGYGYEYGQRHDVGQGRWNGPLVAPYHAPPPLNQFMNPPPPFPHQYAPMPPPTPFAPNGPLPPAFLGMPPSFGGMPMHMHAPLPTYPPLPMAPISPGYSTVQGQPMYMAESSPPTQDMRTTYGAPRQMVPPPFHVREGTVSPSGTTYFNGILPLR